MKNETLLSKKELLQLTGISYGQLYRWKRQNLIPDAWFIKQSSFTGQETFFPKHKILQRISMIMKLKDEFSLDALADYFNPDLSQKVYAQEDVLSIGVEPELVELIQPDSAKQYYTFIEVLWMEFMGRLKHRFHLKPDDLHDISSSVREWLPNMQSTNYRVAMYRGEAEQWYVFLMQGEGSFMVDHKLREVEITHLEEMAKQLNEKIHGVLKE
jgi:predicted DNA-binding transcriptional regulator AlpA